MKVDSRRRLALVMVGLLAAAGSCLAFATGEWVIAGVGVGTVVLVSVLVLRS